MPKRQTLAKCKCRIFHRSGSVILRKWTCIIGDVRGIMNNEQGRSQKKIMTEAMSMVKFSSSVFRTLNEKKMIEKLKRKK